MSPERNDRGRRAWIGLPLAVTFAWVAVASTGILLLWFYANKPGTPASSPGVWPQQSVIACPDDRPVLLLFAHPQCPCTAASLRELERLVTRFSYRIEPFVVFSGLPGSGEEWFQSALRKQAESIPGIKVICDHDGNESDRFGARTSGLTLLYSTSGDLLFEGGITASRGHEGASDGISSLTAILDKDGPRVFRTPVFGCPLQSPDVIASREQF